MCLLGYTPQTYGFYTLPSILYYDISCSRFNIIYNFLTYSGYQKTASLIESKIRKVVIISRRYVY